MKIRTLTLTMTLLAAGAILTACSDEAEPTVEQSRTTTAPQTDGERLQNQVNDELHNARQEAEAAAHEAKQKVDQAADEVREGVDDAAREVQEQSEKVKQETKDIVDDLRNRTQQ